MAFLDTNILLRHVLEDDPDHSPRATALLQRIEHGDVRAQCSATAIMETVYVLERVMRVPKSFVHASLLPIVRLSGVALPDKALVMRALDLYLSLNLPFVDAMHAAIAETLDPPEIWSFDHHFNRVATITRLEPDA